MTQPENRGPHFASDDVQPPPPIVETADGVQPETVSEPAEVLRDWCADRLRSERAVVEAEVGRGVPWKSIQRPVVPEVRSIAPTVNGVAVVAAVRAERTRRQVLTEIGLRRMGNPPFDVAAQAFLPSSRMQVDRETPRWVGEQLDRRLGRGDGERKRLASSPAAQEREALAWEFAKEQARGECMALAAVDVTRAALDEATATMGQPGPLPERSAVPDGGVSVLDDRGERLPVEAFFAERGISPFTAEQWAALPTRPIVMPKSTPPADPPGLATFLFDRVLYASQVCDRNGQAVGLSPEVRQEYVDKVRRTIERGEPIVATEYAPLVAMSNPLKRHTQEPGLAEIDMLRRLAEVSHAVEQYYEPGLRWLLGNEATVFQGPHFGLPDDYVHRFHDRSRFLASLVNPVGDRLEVFDQAELTWGTPERRVAWESYQARRLAELETAFNDWRHPDHAATRRYLNTYIYPMATCISPYRFEPAQDLSVREIAEVYAVIKHGSGSRIRGVDAMGDGAQEQIVLHPAQAALLEDLLAAAHDLAFRYRVTMDSRDELPAFVEAIPADAIRYTMVTKRDKLVLYPNSGRGANFPAHGEPVLLRAKDPRQRSTVTVRPWWQIAGAPDRYVPVYTEGQDGPLYFEERTTAR